MLSNQRVIFSDNGVLTDVSKDLADYDAGSVVFPIVAAQDYIYIGSDLPFNNRYIEMEVLNALPSTISIHYWDGRQWRAAVDVIDDTKQLTQNGIISFQTDKHFGWQRQDTIDGSVVITGLSTLTIYDLYWARISFSADLTLTTEINYIGYKFAEDGDIARQYPDLVRSEVLTQFEAGKTNWAEQLYLSSELVIRDLKSRGIVLSESQILDSTIFQEPTVHKFAELIFTAFGKDFQENRVTSIQKYEAAMKLSLKNIDINMNGRLDEQDRYTRQGFLTR